MRSHAFVEGSVCVGGGGGGGIWDFPPQVKVSTPKQKSPTPKSANLIASIGFSIIIKQKKVTITA